MPFDFAVVHSLECESLSQSLSSTFHLYGLAGQLGWEIAVRPLQLSSLADRGPVSYRSETLTLGLSWSLISSNVSRPLSETRFGSNGSWRAGE
jgi:hypothetical protein